jgi:predicted Zn-dependent protease
MTKNMFPSSLMQTESRQSFLESFSKARLFALGLFVFVACVTLSETGERVFLVTSPQQEAQMGSQAFQDLKRTQKISKNTDDQKRVKNVADRLIAHVEVPNARWETTVFEDEAPNAFALPGGKIGVHTGMLKLVENDAQLAAVMGHEIAHVTMRHSGQRFSAQFPIMLGYAGLGIALQNEDWKTREVFLMAMMGGSQLGMLSFSRDHEYQADQIGLKYMAKAGFDPREAIKFWQLMEKKNTDAPMEFLSTHPTDAHRISRLEEAMPTALQYYQGIR